MCFFCCLLSSHQLSAAANLYEGYSMSPGRCAHNTPPLMGSVNIEYDILFSFHDVCFHCDYFCTWAIIACDCCCGEAPLSSVQLVDSLLCCWLHLRESLPWNSRERQTSSSLGFAKPGFFATFVQSDATLNQLRAFCSLSPDSFFSLCFPFHRWAPLQQGPCLFYMNSLLTLLTTNHVERGVSE